MDQSMNFPTGFRFSPFEEELISSYLKPKILGLNLPCNIVEDKQLYGPNANPWQIFDPDNHSWIRSEVSPGKFETFTYVFVNLTRKATAEKKKKNSKDNYKKKAGCGTWDGQTKRYEIRDCNGDLIGEKRFLVFEINDDFDQDLSKVGYWKMHEYQLRGINENIRNPCNTVLCKITFDGSRKPQVNLRPKDNNDHPVETSSEPQKKNTNVDTVSSSTMNSGTVDGNQGVSGNNGEAIATQTSRDDLVVSDSYRNKEKERYSGPEIIEICDDEVELVSDSYKDKGKEGYSGPEIVELCDDEVECVDISNVTASSPVEQLNTRDKEKERYSGPEIVELCDDEVECVDISNVTASSPVEQLNTRDKEKERYSGPEVIEICDDEVECVNTRDVEDNTPLTVSSPAEQQDTGYPKPVPSDFCWPAIYNNDYEKVKEEGGRRDLNLGKTKVHFSSYQKPNEEQSIKDTTSVLGKRKSIVETLCCPAQHDYDYQKTEKGEGAREELIRNFINFL